MESDSEFHNALRVARTRIWYAAGPSCPDPLLRKKCDRMWTVHLSDSTSALLRIEMHKLVLFSLLGCPTRQQPAGHGATNQLSIMWTKNIRGATSKNARPAVSAKG